MTHLESQTELYVAVCGYRPINFDRVPDPLVRNGIFVDCPACKLTFVSEMSDLDYFQHKLFSALKVPPEYLNGLD